MILTQQKKRQKKNGKTRFELNTAGDLLAFIRPPVTLVTVVKRIPDRCANTPFKIFEIIKYSLSIHYS